MVLSPGPPPANPSHLYSQGVQQLGNPATRMLGSVVRGAWSRALRAERSFASLNSLCVVRACERAKMGACGSHIGRLRDAVSRVPADNGPADVAHLK